MHYISVEDAIRVLTRIAHAKTLPAAQRLAAELAAKLEPQREHAPPSQRNIAADELNLPWLKKLFITICTAHSWAKVETLAPREYVHKLMVSIGGKARINLQSMTGRHLAAYEKDPKLFAFGKSLATKFYNSPFAEDLTKDFPFVKLILEKEDY